MDFLQFLSWSCIVFTLGMFSTGLSDLRKMKATQSAESVQFLPFLTTCVNNLGWLYYGTLKSDGTVMLVNSIGAFLQSLYICTYLHYAKDKRSVFVQTLGMVCLLCVALVYFSMIVSQGHAQLSQLGLTCSFFTITMYLSPLVDLLEIVRTRSVERLSFSLTVATFFTSASWSLYGLQLGDYYIMVPNTPGIATSLIRFLLFWLFGSASRDKQFYKPLQI
ncbi:sugar transporter SWEET1 [Trichomycterus rosablanca]|uniref:sugar transporter SWEET1 n=1 Tax=Trichomycterus rosablanca TaxID=2290929 RepID=UPI002F35E55A